MMEFVIEALNTQVNSFCRAPLIAVINRSNNADVNSCGFYLGAVLISGMGSPSQIYKYYKSSMAVPVAAALKLKGSLEGDSFREQFAQFDYVFGNRDVPNPLKSIGKKKNWDAFSGL